MRRDFASRANAAPPKIGLSIRSLRELHSGQVALYFLFRTCHAKRDNCEYSEL
jgi:hypothetical protein